MGVAVVAVGDLRRDGGDRIGGMRWRSRERESAASDVEKMLGCVEGVGGGAAVAPYWLEDAMLQNIYISIACTSLIE